MTQRDQVIQVMEKLGGIATLGQLNQKVNFRSWKTKTPYASICRIVQDEKYFFKIKPGLWGLNTHKEELIIPKGKREDLDHYYYQGLLLEIGNIRNFQTFVPDQDKNKAFLHTTLGRIRKLQCIHQFSYKDTVRRVRMIDVVWFNRRKMPYAAFEVEYSTDFTNALSKYIALQDFNTKFYVVADRNKKRQFKEKISRDEYQPIKNRVNFIDYDALAKWHSRSMEADGWKELP